MHTGRVTGYSLYELLMTLALFALLVGVGIPSFGGMVANHRLRTDVNALFHAIHLARKESIMRREIVTICASRDGLDCAGREAWSGGWIMFNNRDGDSPPRLDPGEPLLQRHSVDERVVIRSNRRAFTLRATQKRATNGTLVICDVAGRIRPKALVVSYTGRPRVTVEDSRGKDKEFKRQCKACMKFLHTPAGQPLLKRLCADKTLPARMRFALFQYECHDHSWKTEPFGKLALAVGRRIGVDLWPELLMGQPGFVQ